MDPPREFMNSSLAHDSNDSVDQHFSFVTSEPHDGEISGSMEINDPVLSSNIVAENKGVLQYSPFDNTLTGKFLYMKGMSWLNEVEDADDETFDKPLL